MNEWHTKILHSKLEMDEALIKLLTRNFHVITGQCGAKYHREYIYKTPFYDN